MDLGLSGLASGFDWRTFIDQMMEVERAPQARLLAEQNTLQQVKNAYSSINTQLAVLQSRVDALKEPSLFQSRSVQSGDSTIASATAAAGAPLGQFTFQFTQLATAARLAGSANIGAGLSSTSDVSGVTLGSAGFATNITAGKFTVNGAQIEIVTTDTLQEVFDKITAATTGAVSASYDPATDRITLSSAGEIVLGSATDTSNFLTAAKLFNNGAGSISSSANLGAVRRTASLDSANFATSIDDGGSGAGLFKINGVEISFSATADSLQNVIDRINNSDAGVLASYDAVNDRVVLANKNTGDVGISVEDLTGNFAAATGLSTATLERGQNLIYTINGGGQLVNQSNTITEDSSGIPGLTVTASKESSTTITVGSDTARIKTAIKDFIEEFNKAQSLIETNTDSSTDADGKVTSGTLAGEGAADEIGSRLRSAAYSAIAGLASTMDQLEDIGIVTNGTDNTLSLKDEEKLDRALAANLSGLEKLFTQADTGVAVRLSAYLQATIGEEGTLPQKSASLVKQIAAIDTQISDLERVVQANRERLTESFVAMEAAQARINQQLQFLLQRFGGGTQNTP